MGDSIPASSSTNSPVTTNTGTIGSTSDVPVPAPAPQPKKTEQDPKAAAKSAESSKQNAAERRYERNLSGQAVKNNLQKQVPAGAPATDATGLAPGQSISAKVTRGREGIHFEFQRPVTKEQAAAIIFQGGKVPKDAQLVAGPKNTWTVKLPSGAESQQNVVNHFNSHKETITTPPRQKTDVTFPDPIEMHTWIGGIHNKSTGPQRKDLNNDMGFKITNLYRLDEGQRQPRTLGMNGYGYEIVFDKVMTKDEVMKKLFDEEKISEGEVRLTPGYIPPTSQWKVEVIGTDAATAFNRKAFPAFGDAAVYGKESLPTDTPAGVRNRIDNHTVPNDAVKHPPDVYVWEQDGYMMYVKTNNKGKDGYYEPQITKMPTDDQGQIWLRYYMKEQGKAPRQAWQQFWKDTVDEVRMKIGMISGAVRAPQVLKVGTPKSSFGDAPAPTPRTTIRTGSPVEPPSVPVRGTSVDPHGPTQPGKPLPSAPEVHANPAGAKSVPKSGQTDVGTASTQPAPKAPTQPPKPPSKTGGSSGGGGSDTLIAHPPPMPKVKTAQKPPVKNANAPQSGEDIGHASTPHAPKGKSTVDSVKPRGKEPEYANEIMEIDTPRGKEKISVRDLDARIKEAWDWRTKEARRLSDLTEGTSDYRSPASFWGELDKQAAEKYNLPEDWARQPHIHEPTIK